MFIGHITSSPIRAYVKNSEKNAQYIILKKFKVLLFYLRNDILKFQKLLLTLL